MTKPKSFRYKVFGVLLLCLESCCCVWSLAVFLTVVACIWWFARLGAEDGEAVIFFTLKRNEMPMPVVHALEADR